MMGFLKRLFSTDIAPPRPERVPTRDEAPRIFARAFSTDDGQLVLSYLRGCFLARVAGPAASEGDLRYLDGQRGLLQHICQLVEQGKR